MSQTLHADANSDHKITARFAGNSLYKYLIRGAISSFSSEKDAQEIDAFFEVREDPDSDFNLILRTMEQGKDTSKYDMVLAQCLDGIRARAKWSERSTEEVKEWLENWKKQNGSA